MFQTLDVQFLQLPYMHEYILSGVILAVALYYDSFLQFSANATLIEMRKVWSETQDASKCLSVLGRRTGVERHLLVGLTKCDKNDLVTAIAHVGV